MYWNKRCKIFSIVINNVLSIIINIQNTTIFEPVILTGFYTAMYFKGRVTLFFANNYLTEYRITTEFLQKILKTLRNF